MRVFYRWSLRILRWIAGRVVFPVSIVFRWFGSGFLCPKDCRRVHAAEIQTPKTLPMIRYKESGHLVYLFIEAVVDQTGRAREPAHVEHFKLPAWEHALGAFVFCSWKCRVRQRIELDYVDFWMIFAARCPRLVNLLVEPAQIIRRRAD